MSDEPVNIDRDKLRAAIRRLGPEYVFYMLDDAIDLLPLTELEGIAKKYLDLKRLRPDGDRQTKATLPADVKAFDKVSRTSRGSIESRCPSHLRKDFFTFGRG